MKKELEIFINYLSVERGYSTNTLEAYKNDILDLLKFLEKIQMKNLKNVSEENIYGYTEILNSKKYKNSTKSRKIASNKSFFKFLRAENYIQSNPFSEFSQPKVSNKIPDIISIEEIDSIIELSKINNNKFQGYRDSTMIELMYATGMRVSELVNLNLSNIYSSDSIINTIVIKGRYKFSSGIVGQTSLFTRRMSGVRISHRPRFHGFSKYYYISRSLHSHTCNCFCYGCYVRYR